MNPVIDATSLEHFLRNMGADKLPHARGRTLYEHLMGTQSILRHWSQPEWLCTAGGIHSVYGTDVYQRKLIPTARREQIQAAVGIPAERLAYLFSLTLRKDLFEQVGRHGRIPPHGLQLKPHLESASPWPQLTGEESAYLLLLHMANAAEQSCSADGSPALHLADVSRLGQAVRPLLTEIPPVFDRCQTIVKPEDERMARDAYCTSLAAMSRDTNMAIKLMVEAATKCPWVGEPAVWLAYLCLQQGEPGKATAWIARGRDNLALWGTAWDKRLTYEQWGCLVDFIASQAVQEEMVPLHAPDPRNLPRFLELLGKRDGKRASIESLPDSALTAGVPVRFQRYVASFAALQEGAEMRVYPGLRAQPWHEPGDFPMAQALEAECPAIRRELLSLGDTHFARESEPIKRTGNWEVLFLHERGRRNENLCARCPVTSRILEAHGTVLTLAGLCYVSRLRAGTHITPHRGPTNVRLRCHLGIQVPAGNCAIRVDGQTRQWEEGKCLVFDDFLPHEAWNHTAGDRIVLIADLWHPGLTPEEVSLLAGLHKYAGNEAVSLHRYWAANEKARSLLDERGDPAAIG